MTHQAFQLYKDTLLRMNLLVLFCLAGAAGLLAKTSETLHNAKTSFETTFDLKRPGEKATSGEYAGAELMTLGCNDNVTTLFGDDCAILVTPDMILEGTYPDGISDADFVLRVIGDDADETNETEDNMVNDAGQFRVIVLPRIPDAFPIRDWQGCEGYITVEDRRRPQLVNDYEQELTKVKQTLKVQEAKGKIGLSENEGLLNLSPYACFQEDGPIQACNRPYRALSFQVNRTDYYILELEIAGADRGLLALFRDMFDPQYPCEKVMYQTNGRYEFRNNAIMQPGEEGLLRMVVQLNAGENYVAMVTTDQCPDNMFGDRDYTLSLYTEGAGRATRGFGAQKTVEVYRDLLCGDVNQVWNLPGSANMLTGPNGGGAPVFEDCTMKRVWFVDGDVVENGSCGRISFTRTWYAEDENGRTADPVKQIVRFRRPTMSDIFRPAKTDALTFAEVLPELQDERGNPAPTLTGYPFVVSGFGIQLLNESYCNLGASYQDVGNVEICGGVKKVVRLWTFLNWCDVPDQFGRNNGMLINYQQIIKVGNVDPPQVKPMGEITISTGLFDCTAQWTVTPPEIVGGCQECDVEVVIHKLIDRPVYDRYGRATGEVEVLEELVSRARVGNVIPRIEQTFRYRARYFVTDSCGNRAQPVDLIFTARDQTEPVAVCDGNLNLSIDGEGFSRITAKDIDEGSWDNCGPVNLFISRRLINEATRDAFLFKAYGLRFADLVRRAVQGPLGETEVWSRRSDGKDVLLRKEGGWYTWWASETYILCEDAGLRVTVELLVVDGGGTVTSYWEGEDNGNICWLDLNIEDKVAPVCVAPADVRLQCIDLPVGFDPQDDAQLQGFFGMASAVDNCSGIAVKQTRKVVTWECGAGTIVRYFRAAQGDGKESVNTCRQIVTVMPSHDYEIKFPKDATFDCFDVQPDTIVVNEIGCDLLTINKVDERYEVSDDACYKLKRTYKVMNWCEYDGESAPVVVGRNEDCDSQEGEDDVYVLVRTNGVAYIDRDNNENANPGVSPCGNGVRGHLTDSDVNSRVKSVGYWQYSQFIKVYDQTPPEIRLSGENTFCSLTDNCLGPVSLPVAIADYCAGSNIDVQVFFLPDPATRLGARIDLQQPGNQRLYEFAIEGQFPFLRILGRYPIGDHQFEVRATDGCRNQALKLIDFSVFDCKAPEPICINGLAIGLQPLDTPTDVDGDGDLDVGMAVISASDFKIERMNECTGPIRRSINIVGERPDLSRNTLILTCDDPDTLLVEIFVWDSAYNPRAQQPDGSMGGPNYAHCETYVIIQDNQFKLCEPEGTAGIAGLVITEEDETLENVEVRLSGKTNDRKITPGNGSYAFMQLIPGYDYSVSPVKNNDYLNGVSTFDLVLITKHVLGTGKLESPYKMIAADVNNSGSISALDLIVLRKLILGLRKDLPAGSWRFVPASYRFPNPRDPWRENFPEVISYNDVDQMMNTGDFIAIKIGDLNANAKANSLVSERRNLTGVFRLQTEDKRLTAGAEYRVHFTAEELSDILGYQFTLNFDRRALELTDIEYGLAREEHFGTAFIDEGMLTTSWNESKAEIPGGSAAGAQGKAESTLFTLVFRAAADTKLSEAIRITSQYTQAEAYNTQEELLDVQLRFSEAQNLAQGFELYQNQPNPFATQTAIQFYLPEAAEATLTVRDVNGRVLKMIRRNYDRGLHQVSLSRNDLSAGAGLLYYTLQTADYAETKKMLLLE